MTTNENIKHTHPDLSVLNKVQKDFYKIKESDELKEVKDINKLLQNKKYIAFYGVETDESSIFNKVIFYSNDNKWTKLKACFLDSYFNTKERIFGKFLPYIVQDFMTISRNQKCLVKQSDEGMIVYDPKYMEKENKYPCLPVILNKVNPFLSYYLDKYFNNSNSNTIELSIPPRKIYIDSNFNTIKVNKIEITKTHQSIILKGKYHSPILRHKITDYQTIGIINTDDDVDIQVNTSMSEIESDIRKVNTTFLDYAIVLATNCESDLSNLILKTYPDLFNRTKLKYKHIT